MFVDAGFEAVVGADGSVGEDVDLLLGEAGGASAAAGGSGEAVGFGCDEGSAFSEEGLEVFLAHVRIPPCC